MPLTRSCGTMIRNISAATRRIIVPGFSFDAVRRYIYNSPPYLSVSIHAYTYIYIYTKRNAFGQIRNSEDLPEIHGLETRYIESKMAGGRVFAGQASIYVFLAAARPRVPLF